MSLIKFVIFQLEFSICRKQNCLLSSVALIKFVIYPVLSDDYRTELDPSKY